MDSIRLHCSSMRYKAPSDEVIQRWARQIAWNGDYWARARKNKYVNPFKVFNGKSYYGYSKEEGIVDVVASKQRKVDETFKRHFWKRKMKQKEEKEKKMVTINTFDLLKGNF